MADIADAVFGITLFIAGAGTLLASDVVTGTGLSLAGIFALAKLFVK